MPWTQLARQFLCHDQISDGLWPQRDIFLILHIIAHFCDFIYIDMNDLFFFIFQYQFII